MDGLVLNSGSDVDRAWDTTIGIGLYVVINDGGFELICACRVGGALAGLKGGYFDDWVGLAGLTGA